MATKLALQLHEKHCIKIDEYSVNFVFIKHDLGACGLLIDIHAFGYWMKALNINVC